MDDIVKETSSGVQFQNVKRVECEDRRTNMQCKIIHDDEDGTEGQVMTDDFILEDAEVESFSQIANRTEAEFDGDTQCRVDESNELLTCRGGMDDSTVA